MVEEEKTREKCGFPVKLHLHCAVSPVRFFHPRAQRILPLHSSPAYARWKFRCAVPNPQNEEGRPIRCLIFVAMEEPERGAPRGVRNSQGPGQLPAQARNNPSIHTPPYAGTADGEHVVVDLNLLRDAPG